MSICWFKTAGCLLATKPIALRNFQMYVLVFDIRRKEGFRVTIKPLHKRHKHFVSNAIRIAEKKDAGNEKLLNSDRVTSASRSKVIVIKVIV